MADIKRCTLEHLGRYGEIYAEAFRSSASAKTFLKLYYNILFSGNFVRSLYLHFDSRR